MKKNTWHAKIFVKDINNRTFVSSSTKQNVGAKVEYLHLLSLGKEKFHTFLNQ